MNEREAQLFLGCKQGLNLFRVATEEQAKEIKRDYFGTDNDFVLLDIFKKTMDSLDPDARDIIWNTLLVELDLQDIDMTMEQALDKVRAIMTYRSVPILNHATQPLPRVVRTEDMEYTIIEIEPEPVPTLPAEPPMFPGFVTSVPADPTNTRPIPTCQISSQQQ